MESNHSSHVQQIHQPWKVNTLAMESKYTSDGK